jgi:hypothetical protein
MSFVSTAMPPRTCSVALASMFVQVRPLARLELGIVMEELLKRTRTIAVASNKQPVRAVYPPSSFSSLSLRIA